MKRYKNLVSYFVLISVFATIIYFLINGGKSLETGKNIVEKNINLSILDDFSATMHHNVTHPLAILLIQILTIIFTARTFGFIFNKMGQPTVIGEIIAGIFLGPSLLGMWFPE